MCWRSRARLDAPAPDPEPDPEPVRPDPSARPLASLASSAAARADISHRIREVVAMTEREVLAAGATLNRIVDVASAQIESLRRGLSLAHGDSGGQPQGARARAFVGAVHESLERQSRLADEGRTHADKLSDAARQVAALATRARRLAVDARGEAALAVELRRLADEIGEANEAIGGLARSVSDLAPRVEANAEELRAETASFSAELELGLRQAQERQDAQNGAAAALRASDQAIEDILQASMEALSHLQFQDSVAQGLMRLDARMHQLQLELCEELGVDAASAAVPPPMHAEIGGDKPVDAEGAGLVTLF